MTPVPIERIVLPQIKQLEALQLEAFRLKGEPAHLVHAQVEQVFNELTGILRNIPAFRYPLTYREEFWLTKP